MSKTKKKQMLGKINWLSWTLFILFAISVIISVFALCGYISQQTENDKLQAQIDILKSEQLKEGFPQAEEHLYIEYYRELNDKTDDAISGMLTIVGIIAGIIMVFATLIAFKAPRDIEKRIDELKDETANANKAAKKAKEATEDAKYQTSINNALSCKDIIEQTVQLTEIINDNPKKSKAYMYRASKKSEMQNYDGALYDYLMASKCGMNDSNYYYCVAGVYYDQNNYQKAIESYTKSLNENPKLYAACYNRGLAYYYNNSIDNALKDFKKYQTYNPEIPLVHLWIFVCYSNLIETEMNDDKVKEYRKLAEENINEAYKLYPKDIGIANAKKKWDEEHN